MDCGSNYIDPRSKACRHRFHHRSGRRAGLFFLALEAERRCPMNSPIKRSDYMEWAKTCSMARFNLATSGLTNTSIRDFPIHQPGMEITGPGGYGYQPL